MRVLAITRFPDDSFMITGCKAKTYKSVWASKMKVIHLKKRIDDMVYITGYSVKKYKAHWERGEKSC
jgi:hypothetical protein